MNVFCNKRRYSLIQLGKHVSAVTTCRKVQINVHIYRYLDISFSTMYRLNGHFILAHNSKTYNNIWKLYNNIMRYQIFPFITKQNRENDEGCSFGIVRKTNDKLGSLGRICLNKKNPKVPNFFECI